MPQNVTSSLDLDYYIDPSSQLSNIELGTQQFPFKALDDPFRELFSLALLSPDFRPAWALMINIRIKHGSNVTMHSIDMPLLAINSYITIE
jgi:hypothetical protein